MLPTRLFARPATHFQRFHYSVLSHVKEETQSQEKTSDLGGLIDYTESTPNTNRASAPTIQQPYQIFESWKPNTFYSPLDFLRSRRIIAHRPPPTYPSVGPGAKEALFNDAFRRLDINPVTEANNPALLSDFVTRMGKIRPRAQTGLSWRSQRMIARAIKRSRQKGVLAILNRGSSAHMA